MFKIIKYAFLITKNKIILMQPLIIFLLILTFALTPLKALHENPVAFYAVLTNIALMTIAFFSGWFGMIKKTVLDFDEQKTNNQKSAQDDLNLLKEFFPSVGEYFLSMCGCALILSVCFCAISYLFAHYFANNDLVMQMLNKTIQPVAQQKEFIESLSTEQLLTLNKYIFSFAFASFLFHIMILFYPAVIFFKTKNPFTALFESIKCIIKKPLFTIGIYFYLMIISFFVSAIGILGNINILLSLITLFITLLVMSNYFMVIFLGYEKNFNCDNGCNGVRQNKTCN